MTAWMTKLMALNHDLDVTRRGVVLIIAGEGGGWSNFSLTERSAIHSMGPSEFLTETIIIFDYTNY